MIRKYSLGFPIVISSTGAHHTDVNITEALVQIQRKEKRHDQPIMTVDMDHQYIKKVSAKNGSLMDDEFSPEQLLVRASMITIPLMSRHAWRWASWWTLPVTKAG